MEVRRMLQSVLPVGKYEMRSVHGNVRIAVEVTPMKVKVGTAWNSYADWWKPWKHLLGERYLVAK